MITLEQQKTVAEHLNTIVNEAHSNSSFKNELLANPRKAIENLIGSVSTNDEYEFVVEDQTDDSILYLNIPRKVNIEDFELSPEQLEMVSGGKDDNTIGDYLIAAGSALVAVGNALNLL